MFYESNNLKYGFIKTLIDDDHCFVVFLSIGFEDLLLCFVFSTVCSDESDFCTVEFLLMNPTRWNDQNGFWTTLKNQVYNKKTPLFFMNKSSDTNCWCERPLVVAFKTQRG